MVDYIKPRYEVLVGNVGRVVLTNDRAEAIKTFDVYVTKSKRSIGRAAGESVALFADDEIIAEYYANDNPALIQTSYGYDSDDGSSYFAVEYFPPYDAGGAVQHASHSILIIFTSHEGA